MNRKVLFAIGVFLVAFAIPVAVFSIFNKSANFDSRNKAAEPQKTTDQTVPQIVSIPITEAAVGQKYQYKVRAIDPGGDTLEYIVKDKPSWVSWDNTKKVLTGTPKSTDVGTFSVQIEVSDGRWLSTQKYQIVVSGGAANQGSQTNTDAGTTTTQNTTPNKSDASKYGLEPIAQTTKPATTQTSRGRVLGASTNLPNTALPGSVILLSIGAALLAVAAFFLVDANFGIADRFVNWYGYNRGKQIQLKLENGTIIKKRQIKV